MTTPSNLIAIAALTGLVGDGLLQIITSAGAGGPTGWGLKPYFAQHGRPESLFIAIGIMTLFYVVFFALFNQFHRFNLRDGWKTIIVYLAIYGVVLDLVFRLTKVFASLEGYYAHLNYFESALWGAIPMVLPFLIWHYYSR